MKKIVISALALAALAAPVAFAQIIGAGPQPNFNYVNSWVDQLVLWTQRAITFLMVIATIYFLVSVIKFISDKGDKPDATKAKKKAMTNGIIGLAVMVGIWGIVRILTSAFGVSTGTPTTGAPVSCPPGQIYDTALRICR